jgi:hypothetical protein
MQHILVELYNYAPAWSKCPESERTEFVKKVIEAVNGLKSAGVGVVAYGKKRTLTRPIVTHRTTSFASIVCRVPSFSASLNVRSPHPVGTTTSSR